MHKATLVLIAILVTAGFGVIHAEAAMDHAGGEPHIAHVGLIQPDILSITIHEGHNVLGKMAAYREEPDDEVKDPLKPSELPRLYRDGRLFGVFVDKNRQWVRSVDRFQGRLIQRESLDQTSNYTIAPLSHQMPAPQVQAVYRKSTPLQYPRLAQHLSPFEHMLFVKLDVPLPTRADYRIELTFKQHEAPDHTVNIVLDKFTNVFWQNRSIAVHANQVGYHPDDQAKTAYLSCWMGNAPDGGNVTYDADRLRFAVLDTATGRPISFGGAVAHPVKLRRLRDQPEDSNWTTYPYIDTLPTKYNATKVNVYEMDFSELNQPGQYVVYVEGIGTSYPFDIRDDVWQETFKHGIKGLYHQRSGMALDGRFGFARPQNFHPNPSAEPWDNPLTSEREQIRVAPMKILGSKAVRFTFPQNDIFAEFVRPGATQTFEGKPVEVPVWGGYMDAGDWDRHELHLTVSYNLLDLAEWFPDYFEQLDLNLPESSEVLTDPRYGGITLPDILDEGIYAVDFFRRLQTAEGGVRGGIESTDHPLHMEPSWEESLGVFAFAPDPRASYVYAAVAAKAAVVLDKYSKPLSEMYRDSAVKAFAWAEQQVTDTQGELTYETFLSRSNLRNPDGFDYLVGGTNMVGPSRPGQGLLVAAADGQPFAAGNITIFNAPYQQQNPGPIQVHGYAVGDAPGKPSFTVEVKSDHWAWYELKSQGLENWKNLDRIELQRDGTFRLRDIRAQLAGKSFSTIGFSESPAGKFVAPLGGLRCTTSSGDQPEVVPTFVHAREIAEMRPWAAAELFRVTREASYHDVFLTACEVSTRRDAVDYFVINQFGQLNAAYAYLCTQGELVDRELQQVARVMFTRAARQAYLPDDIVTGDSPKNESRVNKAAFRNLRQGWTPWMIGGGVGPVWGSEIVARAYALTREPGYLKALVHGADYGLGANPRNLVYTTGLGQQPVDHVIHCDAFVLGLSSPVGYTVYGPGNVWMLGIGGSVALNMSAQPIFPDLYSWPVAENYHQLHNWPMLTENTVWQTNSPSTYVWGFLAAAQRPAAAVRLWTSGNGKSTVRAGVVRIEGDQAYLKREDSGSVIGVRIDLLSPEDQEFLRDR